MPSRKQFWFRILLSYIALVGITIIDYWAFSFFNADYLRWYVNAGPFIGLATATFAAAWGQLDKHIGLISANLLAYIGECLQVVGLPVQVIGGHIHSIGEQ